MAAAVLGALSAEKLKLLDSAFKNLADVAKNSGPLNDLFDTMKEGSMITAPWQTFLNILKAETTKASIDTIKELFAMLKDPNTETAISTLSSAFSGVIAAIGSTTISLLNIISPMGDTEEGLKAVALGFKMLFTPLFNIIGTTDNLREALKLLGVTQGDITRIANKLRDALKFPEDIWSAIIEFFTGRRISTAEEAHRGSSVPDYTGMYDIGGSMGR